MSNEHEAHDAPEPKARNLTISVLATLACMGLFLVILVIAYLPNRPAPVDRATIQKRLDVLKELRAKEDEAATTYAWVDQKAGTVRIPVEVAMNLIVARQGMAADTSEPQRAPAP